MTQRDAFDDLADDFGARLQQADARRSARRPRIRRVALAGGGLALAGSAAALVLGIGAGSKLDVVSEAKAALEPAGTILHVNYVSGRLGDPHNSTIIDTWVTEDPLRWRFRQQTPYFSRTSGKAVKTDKFQVDEYTYAGGTMNLYYPRQKTLDVTTGYTDTFAVQGLPPIVPGAETGTDPIAGIRGLLGSGRLKDDGPAMVDGRKVRRLKGTLPGVGTGGTLMPMEYDVDAETFVPVRVRMEWTKGEVATVHFPVFERLRTTPQNLALLASDPAPGTKVTNWHVCENADREPSRCQD